jgi:hypothetical protein
LNGFESVELKVLQSVLLDVTQIADVAEGNIYSLQILKTPTLVCRRFKWRAFARSDLRLLALWKSDCPE